MEAATTQSRTDLNSALGTDANRRDWCLCKTEDSLIEGPESAVTETVAKPLTCQELRKRGLGEQIQVKSGSQAWIQHGII